MFSTNSNKKNPLRTTLLFFILYVMIIAGGIIFLATTQDTTLLGDPYYEDKILAPQRAFIPWLFTMAVVVLAIVTAGILFVQRRSRH